MDAWFEVCDKTLETKGTVFIVYNRKRAGAFGDGEHKGKFDGSAQQGELKQAKRLGCSITWIGYG